MNLKGQDRLGHLLDTLEDNIKIDHKELCFDYVGSVPSCCEHGDEHPSSVKSRLACLFTPLNEF